MITTLFLMVTIFVCMLALETTTNAFSKAMSLVTLLICGDDDKATMADLTIFKSPEKVIAEKAKQIKYAQIITQKIFEESEKTINHTFNLIKEINTHTNRITQDEYNQIKHEANHEHQQRQKEQDRKEFEFMEQYFNRLTTERQELKTLEYI